MQLVRRSFSEDEISPTYALKATARQARAKTAMSRSSFSEGRFFWIHDVAFFDKSRQQQ
jgi:hypothetical protein